MRIFDTIDTPDDAIEWLKFLTGSDLRVKILLNLNDGVKDLKELRDITKATSSTILHAISKMIEKKQLFKTEDGYSLTHMGRVQAMLLVDTINAFSTLYTHKEFWLDHNLQGIPESLIKQIGCLSDSTLVRTTPTDLLKPFSSFIKTLSEANDLKCVFPVLHKDFLKIGKKLLESGVNIRLVVTKEVLDTFLCEYRERLKKSPFKRNLKIWVTNEDVNEIFAITASGMSFCLFSNNGVFDLTSQLISENDEAILWGNELFEYYRMRSRVVRIEDI